jgi:hypothetical protein
MKKGKGFEVCVSGFEKIFIQKLNLKSHSSKRISNIEYLLQISIIISRIHHFKSLPLIYS